MNKNTFEKIGERKIPHFLKEIASTNPAYLVPVKKKGCKLLRHFDSECEEYNFTIRYIDYFQNNNIDVYGLRIAIIDDATKFTSMLYKYRSFFEKKGAIVDTYSFVGQSYLKEGIREKYDPKAHIFSYLDEPTYQEYILQQSRTISSDDYFFDIDHVVVRINMNEERYNDFVKCLDRIGELDYVNDIYTPDHIDKLSVFNLDYIGAEALFTQGIRQGALQKIRIAYNHNTAILTVAPLAFPLWECKSTDINHIFDNIPFTLPYENNGNLSNEGIFFNIVFAFHVCLLKHFTKTFKDFSEIQEYGFLTKDMISFVGDNRATQVFNSCSRFIAAEDENSIAKQNTDVKALFNSKNKVKFHTIKQIMDELRGHYEEEVERVGLLNAEYFLSYEEIIERYSGNGNIYKWIDILCDRGVLVTRNRCKNGVFFRGCRSGEGNYDQPEKRTALLIPLAINCCGERAVNEGHSGRESYSINSTYINKVLANLAYDYPAEEFDFHALTIKPNYYGPYTYMRNRIDGEESIPLHQVDRISKYCAFNEEKKEYLSVSIDDPVIADEIDNFFGTYDAVPYTEITAYFQFLAKYRKESGADKYLNELAICREQNTYYRYVYYNLEKAYFCIKAIAQNRERSWSINNTKNFKDAEKHLRSADEKLRFNQQKVYDLVKSLPVDLVYKNIKKRMLGSFETFDNQFNNFTLPILKKIKEYERCLLDLKMYEETFVIRYWTRFFKKYKKIEKQSDLIEKLEYYEFYVLNKCLNSLKDEEYESFSQILQTVFKKGIEEIDKLYEAIERPSEKQYLDKKKRENNIVTINKIKRIVRKNHNNQIVLLYFTYSGFKSKDIKEDNRDSNIVEVIQEYIAEKLKGKLLYGAIGGDENGLLIADTIADAIKFAKDFISWSDKLGKIDIRFGCAYRSEKHKNSFEDNDFIKDVILEAQNSGSLILKENAFIISENTYNELIESKENEKFTKITIGGHVYYEEREVSKLSNDFIYEVEQDPLVRIGIITVLDEEYNAMKSMMSNIRTGIFRGTGAGNRFLLGNIQAVGGEEHTVVLARTIGDGNNRAAIRAERLLRRYPNLDVIFMVGIAGGTPLTPDNPGFTNRECIKEEHVRLGDIVVGDSIIQYDYTKEKINEITLKGKNIPPSAEVLEVAKELFSEMELEKEANLPWNHYIDDTVDNILPEYARPNSKTDVLYDLSGQKIDHPIDDSRNSEYPRVFMGKIASANIVLKNPEKRNQLKIEHKVLAVEMETSGIADSTWEASKSYFAIRGICDYCDEKKNNEWHQYAALAAASFTRALIERLRK